MFDRKKYAFLFQPMVAALLSSLLFFVFVFVFFRPGYMVDDDISVVSLISGYLGGKPLPFLVHSNVLLGLFLNPVYEIFPKINWEILFFIAINFLSVWALIYTLLSRFAATGFKWFAVIAILLCDAYFAISISFTMIAAFAAIAGFCLVITAVYSPLSLKNRSFVFGVALVLTASLIRLKAMLLIGVLIMPVPILFYRSTQFKKQVIAFGILGMLVASGYLIDRYYVQASPDWYAFQKYDVVRTKLHDTPRNMNVTPEITAQVGWSANDLNEFFYNWFFPDKKIYSIENLQYLAEHIPDKQRWNTQTLKALLSSLFGQLAWPYLLIIISIGLTMWFYGITKQAIAPMTALLVTFLGLGSYLFWSMKLPERILLPLLAGSAIFGLFILGWSQTGCVDSLHQPHASLKITRVYFAGMVIISMITTGLVVDQANTETQINIREQAAYQDLLEQLKSLQHQGMITPHALIISPAFGFPLDWANPLTVNFPEIQVLEMGWLTFSPAYEDVLREFDAQPLPEALYEKDNVYIMTPRAYLKGIMAFIEEHKGIDVNDILIYEIPETNIGLYKLHINE